MPKLVKYMLSDFQNESRNKRELSVAKKADFDIIAVDTLNIHNIHKQIKQVDGFTTHSYSKFIDEKPRFKKLVIIHNFLFRFPQILRSYTADVISCHDINALLIGYISTFGMKNKPKLIYDAHELELGRHTAKPRSKFMLFVIKHLEKFLMNRSEFSIVVNQNICDKMCDIHKIEGEDKPIVIRNIAHYWELDGAETKIKREMFLDNLNMPKDTFILMYHGCISLGRGVETLIESFSKTQDTALVLLGYISDSYASSLKELAVSLKCLDRILFLGAVNITELKHYVGASDLGIIPTKPTCENHLYMLPNKLFENVQSLTPLLVSNSPAMSEIINKYNIGLCMNPNDTEDIAKAINTIKDDKELYSTFKHNLINAKNDLCFENEQMPLLDAYSKLFEKVN